MSRSEREMDPKTTAGCVVLGLICYAAMELYKAGRMVGHEWMSGQETAQISMKLEPDLTLVVSNRSDQPLRHLIGSLGWSVEDDYGNSERTSLDLEGDVFVPAGEAVRVKVADLQDRDGVSRPAASLSRASPHWLGIRSSARRGEAEFTSPGERCSWSLVESQLDLRYVPTGTITGVRVRVIYRKGLAALEETIELTANHRAGEPVVGSLALFSSSEGMFTLDSRYQNEGRTQVLHVFVKEQR